MADSTKFRNKLHGARVLVIGGSSGIGYAVAEGAVEYGATVHIASSSEAKVEAAVKLLVETYPSAKDRVKGHVVSLADKETVEKNALALLKTVGEIDHLVHTAGDLRGPEPTPEGKTGIYAAKVDDVVGMGMVRLFSAQMFIKYAADFMPKSNRSSISITSGSMADSPAPGFGWAVSVATGIYGLAKGAAVDLAPIRVNAVSPGPVATPLLDRFPSEHKDTVLAAMKAKCLTGEIADPIDTAEAYLFLMRDKSATGSVVRTNAGVTL